MGLTSYLLIEYSLKVFNDLQSEAFSLELKNSAVTNNNSYCPSPERTFLFFRRLRVGYGKQVRRAKDTFNGLVFCPVEESN